MVTGVFYPFEIIRGYTSTPLTLYPVISINYVRRIGDDEGQGNNRTRSLLSSVTSINISLSDFDLLTKKFDLISWVP